MLISAIMPTRGRCGWVNRALEMWEAQSWPWKELVILDDRDAPSFYSPPDLPGVHYHLIERRMTIGAKRNLAVSRSLGEVIAHWDDDDASAPGRLEDQAMRLIGSGAEVTGYHSMTFTDGERRWFYRHTAPYAIGSSLMYRKSFWRRNPFQSIQVWEDQQFQAIAHAQGVLVSADAGGMMQASIHPTNTSPRVTMNTNNWSLCEA